MNVLITGASGFIARAVAGAIGRAGARVIGVSRSGAPVAGCECVHAVPLGQSLAAVLAAERADAVVHCANDSGRDQYAVNVEGTRRWVEEAHAQRVRTQVFISSLSARRDALSPYGRAKWEIEQIVRAVGGVNLRLGLVVGDGGMFEKMRRAVSRGPLVPLLDGGRSRVYVLGVDFLAGVVSRVALGEGGPWGGRLLHLQQPQPFALVDVLRAIRKAYGYRCVFVPVPSLPVLWAVTLAERLPRVGLPVSSANIRGLRQGGREAYPSDFLELGGREETLDALVARAAAASGRKGSG